MKYGMVVLTLLLVAGLAVTTVPVTTNTVQAQTDERCFAEVEYCISGRIREFWEQNGGLPVFGLPTSPVQTETIEGQSLQVQWFERNRLELHPDNARPYDVQLGRLGADLTAGRFFAPDVPQVLRGDCRYFVQTRQNVCGDLLAAWQASGLEQDGVPGSSDTESLGLFGLPISGELTETLSDGQSYTVQYFERARFERHPENAPPFNVLFGLLANEVRARDGGSTPAQEPRPEQPPQPEPAPGNTEVTELLAFHMGFDGGFDIYTSKPDGSRLTNLTNSTDTNDMSPTWSPDGAQLVFSSNRDGNYELYMMNRDGSNVIRLTDNPAHDELPAWSPDGKWIAFVSDRDRPTAPNSNPERDIYVLAARAPSEVYRLTDDPRDDTEPTWAPNSQQLAYASNVDRVYRIYTMNIDGADKTVLQAFAWNERYPAWSPVDNRLLFGSGRNGNWDLVSQDVETGEETQLTIDVSEDVRPAWSHDGSRIAFQRVSTRGGREVQEIHVMSAGGGESTAIVRENAIQNEPDWSVPVRIATDAAPGGQPPAPESGPTGTIVYDAFVGNQYDLYTVPADGSAAPTNITTTPNESEAFAAWSPDGQQLVFASNVNDPDVTDSVAELDLFLMNRDGTNRRQLTNNPGFETFPDWSPDGEFIVFVAVQDGNQEIYTVSVTTGEQFRLTNTSAVDTFPSWSPDGQQIVFASNQTNAGDYELFIMNRDGSGRRQLPQTPANDAYPKWSPDGSRILFASGRDANWKLYTIAPDGSDLRNITDSEGFDDRNSAWSGDGQYIAFQSDRSGDYDIYVVGANGQGITRLTTNPAQERRPDWSPVQ